MTDRQRGLPAGAAVRRALPALAVLLLVPAAMAAAFLANRQLYNAYVTSPGQYEAGLALACSVPALAGQLIAWSLRRSGAGWWLLHLPGLALYLARPVRVDGAWRPTWAADDLGRAAWSVLRHYDSTPDAAFVLLGCGTAMALLAVAAAVRLWKAFHRGAREIAREGGPGPAGADGNLSRAVKGLPQATWAPASEVRRSFSHPGGIVLGEFTDPLRQSRDFEPGRPSTWGRQGKGRLITLDPADGNGHVLVTTQASGYKTTGLLIPNILTYQGPLVVFDPKCEVYARTKKAREDMDFTPVVIDAENGFDPARLLAVLARDRPSVYLAMAKLMIPKGYAGVENGKYFKDAAVAVFTALLAFYAEAGSKNIVGDVARILSLPASKVRDALESSLPSVRYDVIRNRLNDLGGMEERFYYSVKTEITNQLLFSEFPDIRRYATMPPDSPVLAQALDPKCDIFLNIPQHVAEDFAPMLRLMLGSLLLAAQLTEINEAPRARRLLLIDEAAKLGNMDILENIRDRGRSIGLHLMLFYQTPGAVEKLWGKAGMTSWRDGCSATVTGPLSSRESAQELSTMLGSRTVRVTTEGSSSSTPVLASLGGSVSSSENEQLRDLPLVTPTAISQLPRHASIITAPGHRPVLASKAIWFTRPEMRDRVRGTDGIVSELEVAKTQADAIERVRSEAGLSPEPETETEEEAPPKQPGIWMRAAESATERTEAHGQRPAETGGGKRA